VSGMDWNHCPKIIGMGVRNGSEYAYYVCAELCRRNILALITPKNNPLFDIVASDPEGKRSVQIQVKTMSINNKQGWKLGVNIVNHVMPLFPMNS